MEIRILSKEEIPQANPVWSQAFRSGNREESVPEDQEQDASYVCGVFDAVGLQAVVVVNDYRIMLGSEVIVPMGGIGGVACLPASRGKGYAGACLKFSLAQMRETGHCTSFLFPFSFDYYRRFGWEWIGTKRHYEVPTQLLRGDAETENVRTATKADWPAIQEVYRQVAVRYRGMKVRTEADWKHKLDHSKTHYTYTYLYEKEGKVEGYLRYREGKEETSLGDFLCLTARAYRALLGLLHRHEMQTQKFSWDAPEDDTLWSQFYHWDYETKLSPVTQGRVVDVVAALQAWKPNPTVQGQVVFHLQDECASWNTGTWEAEFEGGHVTVKPTDATPQLSLDIQAFSQAFFGTPTVAQLRNADRLTIHDEAGYTALSALLSGPPVWIYDEF